jgi:hypothetical protein
MKLGIALPVLKKRGNQPKMKEENKVHRH